MSYLKRVTFHAGVATSCPHTQTEDVNEVALTISHPTDAPRAEDVADLIGSHKGLTVTAEDLACRIAGAAQDAFGGVVRVVVRQIEGHGVEAEAIA